MDDIPAISDSTANRPPVLTETDSAKDLHFDIAKGPIKRKPKGNTPSPEYRTPSNWRKHLPLTL